MNLQPKPTSMSFQLDLELDITMVDGREFKNVAIETIDKVKQNGFTSEEVDDINDMLSKNKCSIWTPVNKLISRISTLNSHGVLLRVDDDIIKVVDLDRSNEK